eukprot:scaffold225382_cov19-Tisochrysis_lutea.AAC.1
MHKRFQLPPLVSSHPGLLVHRPMDFAHQAEAGAAAAATSRRPKLDTDLPGNVVDLSSSVLVDSPVLPDDRKEGPLGATAGPAKWWNRPAPPDRCVHAWLCVFVCQQQGLPDCETAPCLLTGTELPEGHWLLISSAKGKHMCPASPKRSIQTREPWFGSGNVCLPAASAGMEESPCASA